MLKPDLSSMPINSLLHATFNQLEEALEFELIIVSASAQYKIMSQGTDHII